MIYQNFNHDSSKYRIPFVLRLCVVLLLLFVLNISSFVVYYLPINSFPDEVLLWLFPCIVLIFYNLHYTVSNLPKTGSVFIILISLFYLTETQYFRGHLYAPEFEYLIGFFKFYVILVCISIIPNRHNVLIYILNISQKIITPFILFFYFDFFFGGNKLSNISSNNDRYINELDYHINGLSFVAVYGIFSTIVSFFLNKISFKSALFKLVIFLGIIGISSSRAAFVMGALLILMFLSNSYSKISRNLKPLISLIIIPIILFIGVIQSNFLFNDIAVIRRIVNNEGTGRETQAKANLINFIDSPYIGKGQALGGVNEILNTRGSNVHFTQTFAAYGFVIGILYIVFMMSLFGPIKSRMNIISKMSLIVFIITFISYNWTLILPLSFIAFINKATKKLL